LPQKRLAATRTEKPCCRFRDGPSGPGPYPCTQSKPLILSWCSWIPGSRAIPGTARQGRPPGDAPRRDHILAFPHLLSCGVLVHDPDPLLAIGGRRALEIGELGLDTESGMPQQMSHLPAEGPAYRQLQYFLLGDCAVRREGAVMPQLAADLV